MLRYFYIFLLPLCLSVVAQQNNDTLLKEVIIEAERIKKPTETYKTISISTNSELSLSDALNNQSSLYLKSYGIGSLTTLSIRGSNAGQTQLLWNGFSINSPTLGQNDLSITSVALVDNAELFLGAGSITNTSGGLGGALQLSNSPDFNTPIKIMLTQEVGSFGIDNKLLKWSRSKGKWNYKGGALFRQADNNFYYRDWSKEKAPLTRQSNARFAQQQVNQNVFFNVNTNNQLALKTDFAHVFRQLPSAIGALPDSSTQEDKSLKSSLEWHYKRLNYFHKIAIGYFFDDLIYINPLASIHSQVTSSAFKAFYKNRYYINDSIQIRVVSQYEDITAASSGFTATKRQTRWSNFIEYYQRLKYGIAYTASVRKEWISSIKTPVTYAFSTRWNFHKNNSFYYSAGKNFRAPTLNDLYWTPGGNPNLNPENGFITELGYSFKNKKTKMEINGYYSLIENWIQWVPGNEGYWRPLNVKTVESKGLEFSFSHSHSFKNSFSFKTGGGYNLVLATNKESFLNNDASEGKELIYIPKNTARLFLGFYVRDFSFEYTQSYTSSVFIDRDNKTYMPYFMPAQIKLNYTVRDDANAISFYLKIINLYNEEYQIMANRPMPGRYFTFGITLNLENNEQ